MVKQGVHSVPACTFAKLDNLLPKPIGIAVKMVVGQLVDPVLMESVQTARTHCWFLSVGA
jgi:hypothetical protein